ncbi:MAG: DNRLRE domain-containing protein [Anaerolineales bacterium]|nr:DNRLRE domain-containing protein [Anaerolineales bacterium]
MGTTPAQALPTSLTFIAEADSQVKESSPTTNYGNFSSLQADGASDPDVEGFIRFTVTGISGTIQSATLRVYDTTNGSANGPVVYGTGTSWTETGITWNNRPPRITGALDNKGNISVGTWVEYNVTSLVTGDGTFSFVLAADSNDAATFSSRQGSQPPQLVVTTDNISTPTLDNTPTQTPVPSVTLTNTQTSSSVLTFIAEADSQVNESNPSTNYGKSTYLQVDGASDPDVEVFIRFTVTGVSGGVQSATLRVYDTTNGSTNGPAVYGTGTSWTETGITWNSRPPRITGALDNKGNISVGTWVEYNVTSLVIGDGTFSFVLVADSNDAATFSSRQGSQPPQLVVTADNISTPTPTLTIATDTPTPSPIPSDSVVLVGAGDISTCSNNNDELTARLLDNIPGTVFTAGDNAYVNGTYTEYVNCYDPTWGRHKSRTKPVPGNHEYNTAGAAGYFQYFDNIDSYYAYDLGTWRIYALNSEIDVSASSPQVTWLQADLAAHPSPCVLAYWHRPRWSSGLSHGSDPEMQTLWQVLYEAGAELVISGHEHHYERFAQMDTDGLVVSQGLREFVAGMGGGAGHYPFGSILPASEVRDNSAYGVLKLTLNVGSYDWQFVPVAGATFTDSGNSICH